MAGLIPGADDGRTFGRRRTVADRGQLFLVVAVAVAALLIVLTVVLNSALYAGNLTARDEGVDDGGALAYRNGVIEAGSALVTYANRNNNSNYGELRSTTKSRVGVWSDLAGRHAAAEVSGANVSVESTSNGTLVDQVDGTRNFTNDGLAADWELVSATSNVRGFHLNVTQTALVDPSSDAKASDLVNDSVFAVALNDPSASERWRVFVYQDGVDVLVKVEDATGTLSSACQATPDVNGRVLVDVSNATVGGLPCPQLDILGEPTSSYDIEFKRGTSAAGTYALFTEQKYSSVNDADFADTTAGPRVSYALYSVTVEVRYVTPTLRYETTVEIVPGERA